MAVEFDFAIFMCLVGFAIYFVCKMSDPGLARSGLSLSRRIISATYRALRWLVIPLLFIIFVNPILGLTVLVLAIIFLIVRTIEERYS
jgi:uncharacterized membrane protein